MKPRPRTSRRRRRLGQHFLTDLRVLDRQLDYADLQPDDVVLEIGPGLGVLTRRLAERVARVVAVELDPAMIAELDRKGLATDNVHVVRGDAAKMDYRELGGFTKVVANLPYSASSPITFQLLRVPFRAAVLMYQLEFAERLTAAPGEPEYGRLAAACAYHARAEILERVPPGAFTPPPAVKSALVRLTPHGTPPFRVGSAESYAELLRVLFSTRRKTIRATLKRQHGELNLSPWSSVEGALDVLDVGERRPEELTPPELGRLDHALEALRHG
ncbi:MAG TPA: 16S rRNA (adenine(1518)-N(6)/adenine(1519)-N(6))-dimethyltransferase RsmA [Candidatus Thermoplasmatota archaeon]|nr:16S rRNA (adenine(1518)-N(6)/adenine(1519)-N(6))-dimethyltransferase RsmA [Candidatus Thermoplasmatota archaeon]